jgi:gas vesicle protein
MLFAPKRGSETRDFLMSKADEGREYVRQKSYELRDSASGMIDKGRGYMGRQRSNFHEAVEAGKDAYRETVHTNEPVHHI